MEVVTKDSAARETVKQFYLPRNPITLDYQGSFASPQAHAGSDLSLNMAIKCLSGTAAPLNAQLSVVSSQLNYQDIQTVTLQRLLSNPFTYIIPIAADTPAGIYNVDVSLKIDDTLYINKQHSIILPEAELAITPPATSYNAGDTIHLTLTNIGSKTGNFNIQALLTDSFKQTILQKQEIRNLAPGVNDALQLLIPAESKTGPYQLVLKTSETLTNVSYAKLFTVSINGLTASLNTYTLKETYFENETISGKAEVTAPGGVQNGTLHARIVRNTGSGGIEIEPRGDFIAYNFIDRGYQKGTKLYLDTYKGLLEYDKTTQTTSHLYDPNYSINKIFIHSNGELWLATLGDGVIRRDTGGNWHQY